LQKKVNDFLDYFFPAEKFNSTWRFLLWPSGVLLFGTGLALPTPFIPAFIFFRCAYSFFVWRSVC